MPTSRGRVRPPRFAAGSDNVSRGRAGQRSAEAWLARRGYRIVERNWRCRLGEIDLVALDGDTLCIVEIKARSGARHGPAIAAVDRRKQHRIARVAAQLLAEIGWQGPCRFDVLGLDRTGDGWTYTLIRDAFEA